jgi:hypothetical protein
MNTTGSVEWREMWSIELNGKRFNIQADISREQREPDLREVTVLKGGAASADNTPPIEIARKEFNRPWSEETQYLVRVDCESAVLLALQKNQERP